MKTKIQTLKKLHREWVKSSRPIHLLNGVECGDNPTPAEGSEWTTIRSGIVIVRAAERVANAGHRSSLDGSWSNGVGSRWKWAEPVYAPKREAEWATAEAARVALLEAENALSEEEYEAWRDVKYHS